MKTNLKIILIFIHLIFGCQTSIDKSISTDSITTTVFIKSPPETVFRAYTTEEGMKKFLAPNIRVNGDSSFVTCSERISDFTEPGHIINKITSIQYPRLLRLDLVAAPPYLPFANKIENLSTSIEFKEVKGGTIVQGTTFGFDDLEDSKVIKELFERINQFTFNQLKYSLEGEPIDWSKHDKANSPEKRYNEFISDSIWFKTYRTINSKIARPVLLEAFEKIGNGYGVDQNDLGFFFFLASNLDKSGFSVSNFKLRFPFANSNHITKQLLLLKSAGLLEGDDQFSFTSKALKLSQELKELINEQELPLFAEKEVKELIKTFDIIVKSALSSGFRYRFPSLIERKKSLISESNAESLKLLLLMDDLVTIRNDASHYRLKWLQPYLSETIEISNESQEILASLGSGSFTANGYQNRATWGHSLDDTRRHMNDLTNAELSVWTNDSTIQLSDIGMTLNDKLSMISEKVFYTPWLSLKSDEYHSFKKIIFQNN